MFVWSSLSRPIVCLAPMAGYTDSAFRQLVKSLAKNVVVFSEFVSSDALHFGSKKTARMIDFAPSEQPFIVQIFGKRPENFAEAARFVESVGAAGVDLNMGCPARKVVSSDHGSALLKNPKLASEIISATVKAVKIPVSVKTRLGISNADGLLDFARMIENSGASLLTIHGRTAKQMYTGTADYAPIYRVKEALKIPVLGNGDVNSVESFHAKLGNLDGLMIGRGAIGNPWLFHEIEKSLAQSSTPEKSRRIIVPKTLKQKLPVILRHCRLNVKTKGEEVGMREMRKYLANYVRGEVGARKLREKLVRVEKYAEVEQLLRTYLGVY